jgi:hypothetical protein
MCGVIVNLNFFFFLIIIIKIKSNMKFVRQQKIRILMLSLYMVMFREQDAGRNHSIKSDNSFFESVEGFKYLGTT